MKKFSLIELLVVVAIIGILSSLLLPALGKSRDKAKMAACKNNMKQIAFMYSMYSDDNDGYYMFNEVGINWNDRLSDYDGRNLTLNQKKAQGNLPSSIFGEDSIYACPADDVVTSFGGNLDCIKLSYSPNGLAGGDGAGGIYDNGRGITGSYNYGNGHVPRSQRISDISKSSESISTFEFSDPSRMLGRNWWSAVGVSGAWGLEDHLEKLPHEGVEKANYMMVDGHVESLNFYKTLQTSGGTMGSFSDTRNTMWDSFK
ncbi:type II secretion system protein [Lentisphaera profundi]|uniref:Type II secretion system protein n=1 Tax=Lentisphaera profundi TaxID=1658616 RepID=A0ABY7W1W9_9BACT|nr:type II secretion system protein [Lentisphaera profundi]WDE99430.1 type II secretion system protein [Lentisphaera profundi]